MGTLTDGAPLPGPALFLGLVIAFVILSFVTHLQQYQATYGLVYNEVKTTRLNLAERLRKLPLGYFGKRDLADLTETLMGDVNRMEHVWSHVLGYLYGSYLSTALIAVCLLVYDWQLAIACLWGVPVAFGLLCGTRRLSARSSERTKKAAVRVSHAGIAAGTDAAAGGGDGNTLRRERPCRRCGAPHRRGAGRPGGHSVHGHLPDRADHRGRVHRGLRAGRPAPGHALTDSLRALGLPLRRFKTGTPPRIHRGSVNLFMLCNP